MNDVYDRSFIAVRILLVGGAIVGVVLPLLTIFGRVQIRHFPDPEVLKRIPKPGLAMVPSYPNVSGTESLSVEPDYPCAMKEFATGDSPEATVSTLRNALSSNGWSEWFTAPGPNKLGYWKGGYDLEVDIGQRSVQQTQVSIRLCMRIR